jgi:chemotaxis family two-component system sensor kinase Cph1
VNGDVVRFGQADLTNCDREQIHIPGSIQPHGCLLALEPGDLRVVHAGGDSLGLLGVAPLSLLKAPFSELVGPRLTATINGSGNDAASARRLLSLDTGFAPGGADCDAVVHRSSGLLVLELEPRLISEDHPGDTFRLVQDLVSEIQATRTVEAFQQAVVDGVRQVSGFDRVMLYRFVADGSGAVDAESLAPGADSYLGLRYPASDIPAQARELYLRNTLRLIPDARYAPAPIHAVPEWRGDQPLDLTYSLLRSVSPLHLEYLANMGVTASMSISVVIDGRLWGLIACHHREPRYLPARIRMALDLFGNMLSFQLETRLNAQLFAERMKGKRTHETLIRDLAGDDDVLAALRGACATLLDYVPSGGLALCIDGHFDAVGNTPSEAQVRGLVAWLNESVTDGLFHTDRLAEVYPPAENFLRVGAGVLAVSVSRSPRDYLIWFRPEVVHLVRWAGDPRKAVAGGEGGAAPRLSPRKSFADWRQQVRGQSDPWLSGDIAMAGSLRVSLLEVVLEHVDQLARARERAQARQETLLTELDERIAQWEQVAGQLRVESDRRAIVEAELSQVLRRTVIDQEAERQRIARELHDSLGQYLTAMSLDLDGIARDRSASSDVKARVGRLKTLAADAGQEVNHLAWEIRPTALDDLGLQTAVQQFLEQWGERSDLVFDLHMTLQSRRLPQAVESALYRVLQESIHNVVKHAAATRVGVILEASASEVRLIVEDNGRGFAADVEGAKTPSTRLGLLGMRERLALVGGSLEIETVQGEGTTLLVHVPI